MQKRTVISVMVVIMLLVVALYFVGGTYARYIDDFTGSGSVNVAKWAVKVGESESETFTLSFEVENSNNDVVSNKIAPSVSASSKLNVDLNGTEVAVDLIVEKGDDFDSTLESLGFKTDQVELKITSSPDNTSNIPGVTGTGTKSSPWVIPLQDDTAFTGSNGVFGVELTLKWENDEAKNENDTKVGKQGGTIKVPVKVTVKQHITSEAA